MARCGLGSSVGVKELSSVCYHPQTEPSASIQRPLSLSNQLGCTITEGVGLCSPEQIPPGSYVFYQVFVCKFCSLCLEGNVVKCSWRWRRELTLLSCLCVVRENISSV